MKRTLVFLIVMLILASQNHSISQDKKYPAPRFPSYLRTPKTVDEIMPYARAAARQIGGRHPWVWSKKANRFS